MVKTDIITERLNKALREKGVTQAELARRLNLPPTNIWRWCKGDRLPGAQNIRLICKSLDISANWLLGLCD